MAKEAWETLVAFKLVWVRVMLYVLVPSVTAFLTQTETWSGETWDNTHWFLKARLVVSCSIPGCLALAAFIDQSLQRAKEELKHRRSERDTGP